jgi:hypothetical protein
LLNKLKTGAFAPVFFCTFRKYMFKKVESINATKASAGARGLAQAKFSLF